MKAPSQFRLEEIFALHKNDAKAIRAFAKAADDPDKLEKLVNTKIPKTDDYRFPKTQRYVQSLYSSPYDSYMWRVTVALHAINEIMGGYGVEALNPEASLFSGTKGPPFEYINFGDPYVSTLIYDRNKDTLFIGSWGDIVETDPRFQEDDRDYNPKQLKSFLSR